MQVLLEIVTGLLQYRGAGKRQRTRPTARHGRAAKERRGRVEIEASRKRAFPSESDTVE